jgi:hypothetical protein
MTRFGCLLLACLAVAACSSSSTSAPDGDAASDAASDTVAPLACPTTIDAYCAGPAAPPDCTPRDYPTALYDWCFTQIDGGARAYGECGDIGILEAIHGADTTTRYFSKGSAELLAIVVHDANGARCVAGPTQFVVPTCTGESGSPCGSIEPDAATGD